MSPVPWLALAVAVLLMPRPVTVDSRVGGLVRRGRLALAAPSSRRLPPPRPRTPVSIVALAGGVSAAVAVGLVAGPALAVAVGVVALTVAALTAAATARRRDARCQRELLAAVRLIVAELEAGSPPPAALRAGSVSAPRYASALTRAAAVAESGGDPTAAFLSGGGAELVPLAHAWRVGTRCGAPIADVLARVAADLADQEAQRSAVTVVLAGPRSTAALLAGLPVVGLALGAAMGARPAPFLLGDPGGRLLCCLGVVLDAAGVFWTQRLMSRAQRE